MIGDFQGGKMKIKKIYISLLVLILIFILSASMTFRGCSQESPVNEGEIQVNDESSEEVESSEIPEVSKAIPITPQEVYEIIIEQKDYLIIDVRNPDEYAEGHLEGAVLIPVFELEGRLDELPEDKPIIVYCRTGGRSANAATILVENGFDQVYDMGGIMDWIGLNYPVIVGTTEVIEITTITIDEAYDIYTGSEAYLFIDVRSEDEFNSGHVEGAIHIPVGEIGDRLGEIPDDKILIVYCNGSGCNRSGTAANTLVENGFDNVYDIGGRGIFEWEEKGYPVE